MWISVALPTDASHAESLSDALLEAGALSVSVEDALAGTDREEPQFGEPGNPATPIWEHSRLLALFEPAPDLGERIAAACRNAGLPRVPALEFTEVEEQNWVQLTQSQFEPIHVNQRLWIVPSWHLDDFSLPDDAKDACVLQLDPGMAFGTGSHPTTRLCLNWLADAIRGGERVLDYGCGSGILAIAALRLGAGSAVGVDIDDAALAAAHANALNNRVGLELRNTRTALEEEFDLVVANILTNPLRLLAPLLGRRVAAGGRIALSGVLETQADAVIEAYAPLLALHVGAAMEGWCRLEGGRP